jgi:hypothetical protein
MFWETTGLNYLNYLNNYNYLNYEIQIALDNVNQLTVTISYLTN